MAVRARYHAVAWRGVTATHEPIANNIDYTNNQLDNCLWSRTTCIISRVESCVIFLSTNLQKSGLSATTLVSVELREPGAGFLHDMCADSIGFVVGCDTPILLASTVTEPTICFASQ